MPAQERFSTGIPALDQLLGGGLLPGTLTVVLGATGIGKTQLGLQFAHAGLQQEGEKGCIFDLTTRGDAQNHHNYAQRMFDWILTQRDFDHDSLPPQAYWDYHRARCDYAHLFHRGGRRVTRQDIEPDEWHLWKQELNRKLEHAIGFFYGNFVHGVQRCVIDGVEPVEQASDSFQFHVFNYVYHQIIRKEHDWVARDLFRAQYREQEPQVLKHAYDYRRLTCLLLLTSHEVLLEELATRPIQTGDELANANTIILMGKIREGRRMRRALFVSKHRGSACEELIIPYEITATGIALETF